MNSVFNRVFLTLVVVLAAGTAAAETKVFLLAGQSNMAGLGIVSELSAPYNSPQTDVNYWSGGQWVALRGGFGYNSSQFGPEVSFGRAIKDAYPDDEIYLVKHGVSGTSLAVNWDVDGIPPAGDWYRAFRTKANEALDNLSAAGKTPVVAGMLWMQGESDAQDIMKAAYYQINLVDLINTARSDFDTPDMPFVIGEISAYGGFDTNPPGGNATVRQAQENLPTVLDNVSCFDTNDLTFNTSWPIGGHYGTDGQIELGKRFAAAFTTVPEPSTLVLAVFALGGLLGWAWRRR